MRKITYAAWSVEMNKWLVKMRSLFRVVKPGISILLRGHRPFGPQDLLCSLWSRQKAPGSPAAMAEVCDDHGKGCQMASERRICLCVLEVFTRQIAPRTNSSN